MNNIDIQGNTAIYKDTTGRMHANVIEKAYMFTILPAGNGHLTGTGTTFPDGIYDIDHAHETKDLINHFYGNRYIFRQHYITVILSGNDRAVLQFTFIA